MAILGIGLDVVDLKRFERLHQKHGETFIRRFCRPGEWQERKGHALIEHVGGLFAAKEAVMKALGTGWAEGLGFHQIEIVRSASGAPSVLLHHRALARARELDVEAIHLSITHERTYASAVAVLEGQAPLRSSEAFAGSETLEDESAPKEDHDH